MNIKEKALFVASVAAAVALIAFVNGKFELPVVGAYLPKPNA